MMRRFRLLPAILLSAAASAASGQGAVPEPEKRAGGEPGITDSPAPRPSDSPVPVSPVPVTPAVFHRNLARWNAMPEAERQKIREKFARLKAMAPEDRTALVENAQRFLALPAEKQKEMADLVRALTPEERKAAQQAIRRIRQAKILPDGAPAAMLIQWVGRQPDGALDRLRQMTPEERKAEFQKVQKEIRQFALEQIRARMTPEERAAFDAMTPEERMQKARRAIRDAWESQRGRLKNPRPVEDGGAKTAPVREKAAPDAPK